MESKHQESADRGGEWQDLLMTVMEAKQALRDGNTRECFKKLDFIEKYFEEELGKCLSP